MIPSWRKISDLPVAYQIDKPMRYQIMLLLPEISYESYLENFTHRQTYDWPEDPAWIIFWTCLISSAVKSSAKSHLHVFSYIYPFLSPFTFLLATFLSYFFSFVSFRHMTSASLQPWTDKDTQMPRIDTLPLIQSYSCCANAEPILTALEERNRERERKWQRCVWRWRLALPIKLFSRPSTLRQK